MPRGDKNAIMRYEVPTNDKERQLAIVAALSPLRQKLILNARINGYLAERQLAIVAALSPLRQKLILNARINGYLAA